MILLTGSSTLRVYLGAPASTNELPIVATYVDSNSTNFTPQAAETTTNGTNPVTVVYSPVSGLSRQIKYLSVLNTDTTTNEVYVDYHTPSSDRRLFKQSLTPNQKIEFLDTEGFEVIPEAFLTVTGNVTGMPFITYQSTPLLYNHRVSAARSGIQIIDEGTNAGSYSFGLSGNMYHNITGHTGDLSQHITGLSISNQLLDQTLVWNTTGWINKYPHSVVYATNAEATTLNIGEVVYLSGAQGDRASVRRASNLYENTSSKTVGMVSFPIASAQAGAVVTLGYVEKLNLGTYSPGDVLWLGDTPGTFTSTKPTTPSHLVFVGVVARANAGNGIAFIRTQNGYELEELHDVKVNSNGLISGQFLKYTTGIWQNTGLYTGDVSGFTTGVKYAIGSTGFFEYRGGLTGQWDPITAKLTLNLYSGAGVGGGATELADLTDVSDVLSPINGHVLYYNTEWTSIMANENFVLALAPSPTGANLVGNIALTGTGGIDIWGNYSSNRIIVSGQKTSISASLTGLGVAGFNSTNFAVSNGIATITGGIQTGQIVGYGVTTGQVTSLVEATQDTISSSLATTSGLAVIYDDILGTITISGERATTVNPGLAIFSATNFTVSSGMALITGGLQTGYVVGLVPAIQNTVGSSIGFINLTGVLASGAVSGDYLIFNGTGWTGSPTVRQVLQATKTPNGHENRAESTLAFNEGTREFSITPVGSSFSFWNSGKRYTKTTAQTKVIPDTSGLYYFYFDNGGNLQYKNTYFEFANEVHTAYVYWNPEHDRAYYFADERHGVTMDWQTHLYLHRTRGAAYANGFGASNYTLVGAGTSDTDCQLDIANGSFFDEDIEVAITHSASPAANSWQQVLQGPAEIPIFYLSGAGLWIKDTASEFPVKQGTHTAQYNILSGAIWTGVDLSGAAANQTGYGITWIIATNNLNSPILGVLGQAFYTGLGGAEAASWTDVTLPGFPIYEFRPLYKVIYEAYSGFSNTPKARFRSLVDLRLTQSVAGGIPATPVSDHGSLVGLSDDDHPQYSRVDGARGYTAPVAGQEPVNADHLATKSYVDSLTSPATTNSLGIAQFDPEFFEVTAGNVNITGVQTGFVTDLRTAIKNEIGTTGEFFIFKGGLDGVWDTVQKKLTLNWISGSTSAVTVLDGLDDVILTAPSSGQVLAYDGINWRNSGLTTGNIALLGECIRDEASSAITGISGIVRDYNDAGDSIRLSGVKATTTTPGIAAFSPTYFAVTDALVAITGGIQGSQISNLTINTGQITDLIEAIVDETYLALRSTSGLSIVYSDTNGTITLSGERANYNQIGLAAFNSSHFTVNSGHVSLTTPAVAASETVAGILEIATNAEAGLAAATDKALVPSNIGSIKTSALNNDAGFLLDITAENLADLADVVEVSPASTQFLMRGTGLWTNSYVPTGSVTNLRTAVKNEIGTPGEFFEYRGGLTGYWNNSTKILTLDLFSGAGGPGGASALDDLTDVTITSVAGGQFLGYNGTAWINSGVLSGDARWNASGVKGIPVRIGEGDAPSQLYGIGGTLASRDFLIYLSTTDLNLLGSSALPGYHNSTIALVDLIADQAGVRFGADNLQGTGISTAPLTSGQTLYYNGTQWMGSGLIGYGTGTPSGTTTGDFYFQYFTSGSVPCEIGLACSDETTALTVGTAKTTFRMPYTMFLTGVRANVNVAPTGSVLTVDINEGGTTILSTKLTIDATERTSTTAATPFVLSDTKLNDDSEITIDIDTVGSTYAGRGLKVWLLGVRL